MPDNIHYGNHAGFFTEQASINHANEIADKLGRIEYVLNQGLCPQMVDERSTPDLHRVIAMVDSGKNWPSEILSEKTKIVNITSSMIALKWGNLESERLVVLRPFWKIEGKTFELYIKGIEISHSQKYLKADNSEKSEYTTSLSWETERYIGHNLTIIDPVLVEGQYSLKELLRSLINRDKWLSANNGNTIEIPESFLVYSKSFSKLTLQGIVPLMLSQFKRKV